MTPDAAATIFRRRHLAVCVGLFLGAFACALAGQSNAAQYVASGALLALGAPAMKQIFDGV